MVVLLPSTVRVSVCLLCDTRAGSTAATQRSTAVYAASEIPDIVSCMPAFVATAIRPWMMLLVTSFATVEGKDVACCRAALNRTSLATIATATLLAATKEAARLGYSRIVALIRPSNRGSLRAFSKAGYVETGREQVHGQDAVRFERSTGSIA